MDIALCKNVGGTIWLRQCHMCFNMSKHGATELRVVDDLWQQQILKDLYT